MIPIWKLTRGDLFRLEGCDVILEFSRMDGAYARCYTSNGELALIGLCDVELIQGK